MIMLTIYFETWNQTELYLVPNYKEKCQHAYSIDFERKRQLSGSVAVFFQSQWNMHADIFLYNLESNGIPFGSRFQRKLLA